MADSKFSALTALAAAAIVFDDIIPIVDTSATLGKKTTIQDLMTVFTGATGMNGATETTSKPLLDHSQTWNAGGVQFALWRGAVTNTASAAGSMFADLRVGSAKRLSLLVDGAVCSYNAYTDDNNYERGFFRWNTNTLEVGAEAAGAGTSRTLQLNAITIELKDAVRTLRFNSGNLVPLTNNGSTLGGASNRWSNVYAVNNFVSGYLEMAEMTAPSAPSTNNVRIYAEDNGSGKTRLMALFPTGAAQQVAIEP